MDRPEDMCRLVREIKLSIDAAVQPGGVVHNNAAAPAGNLVIDAAGLAALQAGIANVHADELAVFKGVTDRMILDQRAVADALVEEFARRAAAANTAFERQTLQGTDVIAERVKNVLKQITDANERAHADRILRENVHITEIGRENAAVVQEWTTRMIQDTKAAIEKAYGNLA